MIASICFKCGMEKPEPLLACGSCRALPQTNSECAVSLALSNTLASQAQLSTFRCELRDSLKVSVPRDMLITALGMLKTPKFVVQIGRNRQPVETDASQLELQMSVDSLGLGSIKSEPGTAYATTLHRSPFHVLGATTRDDRRRIVELAEERSLDHDHDACQKARSDLTTPRTRLSAEVSWLPGVSPRKAAQLLDSLSTNPKAIGGEAGLPVLAHLNLLAAAFERVDANHAPESLCAFIEKIAGLADVLSVEDVLREINEDRTVSGFPEVRALDQLEAELTDRKREYRNAIKNALDELPTATLLQVMTEVVDNSTGGGVVHAPKLIDDLVDTYEAETQDFLQKEAENVHKLIKSIRDLAGSGEGAVKAHLDKLDAVARNWDKVAQPIQLSAKARGIDHEPSRDLAYSIRSLAIDLFNEHNMLAHSQRLTDLLQELFAEVPDVSERVEQDADALADIFDKRKEESARKNEWEQEISYRAEVGLVFKDVLSISPEGVSWKNQKFPLDAVTRVRWGGVRHSVNGIPTGTTYTIAFGDNRSEAVVELRNEQIFDAFTERLWRAVGVELLVKLLQALKAGAELKIGNSVLRDDGITFNRAKFFGGTESVRCSWSQIQIWSADGSFFAGAVADKKAVLSLSFIHSANAHVYAQAIQMAFKKQGMRRLSDLLQ